ncbi:MAG: class I SAM-dependent methyltransferase [Holophagales bacterium]|jgi:SAM-dependent methyltransferase|nr:class I SAM-dependent methyltransferase [Holophagales bacterium]
MPETGRFDQAAATWDAEERRILLARGVTEAIAARCALPDDLDVLDFGCGTGLVSLGLRPLVRRVTGVDTSRGMLDVFERKVLEQGLDGVRAVLLPPGAPLSLPDRFHLVVSSMTLHHVADLAPLFARFHDHLQPGGRVALADLDHEDGTFHEDARGVVHLGFDRGGIVELLAGAGFVDVEVETAAVTRKGERLYPVFLATGRKVEAELPAEP